MQKLNPQELLAQYAEGQRSFTNIDLKEADLFEANLPDIDLSRSHLQNAYLP
jgi:uncharacterized protein YjbI with pentapeptide repeats